MSPAMWGLLAIVTALALSLGVAVLIGRGLRRAAWADVVAEQHFDTSGLDAVDAHFDTAAAMLTPDSPAIVAGPDLTWQSDLNRIYRDYDAYRYEQRLPGERVQ